MDLLKNTEQIMIKQTKDFLNFVVDLQNQGFYIYQIELDNLGDYVIWFSDYSVCRGLAFGGTYYRVVIKNDFNCMWFQELVGKDVTFDSLSYDNYISMFVDIDERIKTLQGRLDDEDRNKALKKLTDREKKLLGIKL